MIKEVIPIHKRYLVIDSPIDFTLIANNGTDEVYRPSGAWQLDMWQLLSKEYFKQYPVFTLEIEYDETKLPENKGIVYRQSDINLGTGLSGVNGQAVQIIADSAGLATVAKQDSIISAIQNKDLTSLATSAKQDSIISAIQNIDLSSVASETTANSILTVLQNMDFKKKIFEILGTKNQLKNLFKRIFDIPNNLNYIIGLPSSIFSAIFNASDRSNNNYSIVVTQNSVVVTNLSTLSKSIYTNYYLEFDLLISDVSIYVLKNGSLVDLFADLDIFSGPNSQVSFYEVE